MGRDLRMLPRANSVPLEVERKANTAFYLCKCVGCYMSNTFVKHHFIERNDLRNIYHRVFRQT